ncbi:MAG: ABC transporter ATP-binding protein [Jatrophihabitans sp.]|uniref:ABC transporter ATP-binding protein n=1 Tax=Jatrophihabitans sp. TaxID=1932789 RepID=UPI003F808FA5
MRLRRKQGDDALSRGWRHLPRALPYLRPYKQQAGGAVAITALLAALSFATPWPLALVIDTVLGSHPAPWWVPGFVGDGKITLIVTAVVASVGVTLLSGAFSVVNEYLMTSIHLKVILDLRARMFQHVLRLSPSFHDENKSGVILYKVNNQSGAIGQILTGLPEFGQSILTVLGMAFIAWTIDPVLALVALGVVPIIVYSTRYYADRIDPDLQKVRELEGQSLSIVHEVLAMYRVIVSFGRERHEYDRFRRQGNQAVDARVRVTVHQTVFSLIVNLITACGTAAVLGVGAYRVLHHDLTLGQLTVVLAYVAAVYQPLEQLTNSLTYYQMWWTEFDHALTLLDTPIDVQEKPTATTIGRARGELTFDHVSFDYATREGVIRDVSFTVPAGSSVALVGPTGAGKTTLTSLLPRLYDPSSGRVLLDGIPVDDLALESLRDQFSIVLQEPVLFSGTIADNIRYGWLYAQQADIERAAKAANAHDFIMKLPKGYDTLLGERGVKISGGERQRISIARAFLRDAPILILDEPTSSIDSRTEEVILDALDRLMEGRTTIMVAHRLSTIRHADQILVLNHGRLEQAGGHDDLVERDGLYRQLWTAQTRARKRPPAAPDTHGLLVARPPALDEELAG